jgi:hypothetical protein
MNPVNTHKPYFFKIQLILSSHLHLGLSGIPFLTGIQIKLYMHFSSPLSFMPLNLITLIFGEEYKL